MVEEDAITMNIKTYSELLFLPTFLERYRYLKLNGLVGEETFGFDRYINQKFYRSKEWKEIRNIVILRDNGCDLGVEGYDIHEKIIIHHMNPISIRDIERSSDFLMNPEYLISTVQTTHNAIHYGDEELLFHLPMKRTKNDTCPWKNKK